MKVRFGFTAGPETTSERIGPLVEALEDRHFDSLWIPEVLQQPFPDPIVGLAYAAARTTRLKLGSHLIIPGRNAFHLARQLAQIDQLCDGRLLLVGVLGLPAEADAGVQGIERKKRAAALEEAIPLLHALWRGDTVTHDGPRYQLRDARLPELPRQQPLELWLGGQVRSALERCGRLGDGWMPGLVFPAEAAELRSTIEESAAAADRTVDPEHFGANLFYAPADTPQENLDAIRSTRKGPDHPDLIPVGFDALRRRIDDWLEHGFSKFLLRPLAPRDDFRTDLDALAREILPLTT